MLKVLIFEIGEKTLFVTLPHGIRTFLTNYQHCILPSHKGGIELVHGPCTII
jgi:hypothetical protein